MKQVTHETSTSQVEGHFLDKSVTVILASAVLIGIVYALAQPDQRFLYALSNGLPPILAFVASAIAIGGLIRNRVSLRNRVSSVWLGYSLGVLLWFLGESTWAAYALWYSVPTPFPSLADAFWLAGYVPLLCAIVMQSWPFREFLSSRKMLTISSIIFVLAIILLSALIPTTYASEIGQDLVAVVVSVAYPLLDVVLLVVALPILFLFGRGTFWRPFLFVTIGLILTFLGDISFSWATLTGVYYDGSYLELLFHWSYLTLSYGFYLRLRSGSGANMLE